MANDIIPPDGIVKSVLLDLSEHFADLDDQEDAPFGELARVGFDPVTGLLRVRHESEPWGIDITVRTFTDAC